MILGALAAGMVLAASIVGAHHFQGGTLGPGQDAHAYWLALRGAPYAATAGEYGAYLYSPAFVQALSPVLALAWPQFLALWSAMLIGTLLILCGPVLFALVLPLAFFEIWGGNIHLLVAIAVVVGFKHPHAWAFVLLTKVTPGVGLVWFAVRGEWRHLALAAAATGLVVGLSIALDPAAWLGWLELLSSQTSSWPPSGSIGIPIGLRLPIAVAVIAYAAARDRAWLVPVGVLLAMPYLWWGSLSVLIASLALERSTLERRVTRAIAYVRFATRGAPMSQPGWLPERP
jgi:hypothetical protein